jgi:hypothetical protein
MEPPIGYGSTHRSIFPDSQFRSLEGIPVDFFRVGQGKSKAGAIPVLIFEQAAARFEALRLDQDQIGVSTTEFTRGMGSNLKN